MGIAELITIIIAIVGVAATVATSVGQTVSNKQSIEETNEANLQAVRETNAANVEQANLAYKRSLPVQQIADMRNAGISLPAAINKLTGGGQYQMPTLQSGSSQASQMDLSNISSAFEHLGSIPSNVIQSRMQNEQLAALRQEMNLRQEAANREAEKHQFEMWQNLYGKEATLKIDALSSEIVQMAADKGISLDNIDSVDKLVRAFDLGNNANWRSMPNIARSQVLEGVRLQAAENRANQSQSNSNRAAQDQHNIATATIKQMREDYQNSIKEYKTQDKERIVRDGEAQLKQLLNERNIKIEEMRDDIRFDEKGNPYLSTKASVRMKEIWKDIGTLFGIDYLGDILRGMFAFTKP